MKKGLLLTALAISGLAFGPGQAAAQVGVGAEAMFGSKTDFGLGGRVLAGMGTTAPLDFQGGFAIYFPDGPAEFWEANANIWYRIDASLPNGDPYVGGGLNIGRASGEGASSTELGVNLGGGFRWNFTNTAPFVEARFVVGGHDQFVIGGGVAFGGF
jgi:hypothetical protein